jgi:hypothetical protein
MVIRKGWIRGDVRGPVCITLMAVAQVLWGSRGGWKRGGSLSGGEYIIRVCKLGFAFDLGGCHLDYVEDGVRICEGVVKESLTNLRIGVFCWTFRVGI